MLSPVGFPNFAPCNKGHFFGIVIWSVWQPAMSKWLKPHKFLVGAFWTMCVSFGKSPFAQRLSLPPARGNAPTKALWGFSFGTDRTPHESRGRKWGCSELNRTRYAVRLGGRSRTIRGTRRRPKSGGVRVNPSHTWVSRKGVESSLYPVWGRGSLWVELPTDVFLGVLAVDKFVKA